MIDQGGRADRPIRFGDDNRFDEGATLREAIAFDIQDDGRIGYFVFLDNHEVFTIENTRVGWRPGPDPGEPWYVERWSHDGTRARLSGQIVSAAHVRAIVAAVHDQSPHDIVRFMAPHAATPEELAALAAMGARRI